MHKLSANRGGGDEKNACFGGVLARVAFPGLFASRIQEHVGGPEGMGGLEAGDKTREVLNP
jgi:hypothetical protein